MLSSTNRTAKILLVDDQKANIDVLTEFLQLQGYSNITFTTNSREVEDLIKKINPDIILLDLLMPYVSGFQILEKMKELTPKNAYLPVLVLTADITPESKRKALQLGASDFLTKPFDLTELQARINTHLQIRFKTEEINNYAEQQKMLVAAKDKFFSIIAHDVSTPFTGIINFCKIIINQYDKVKKEDVKKYLEIINSTAQNGQELLSNLLKWAQSQTGIIQIEKRRFSLNNVIKECFALVAFQAESKKIKLIAPEKKTSMYSDRSMIETIIRNLLSNAVKFTPVNGTITVSAKTTEDCFCITVQDTGIGIEADEIKKLFKIDGRLQSRRGTSNEFGSGLGLILCKEFVDKLNGTIEVESVVNQGTKFCVKFPLN